MFNSCLSSSHVKYFLTNFVDDDFATNIGLKRTRSQLPFVEFVSFSFLPSRFSGKDICYEFSFYFRFVLIANDILFVPLSMKYISIYLHHLDFTSYLS